jgi:hypothetical protein
MHHPYLPQLNSSVQDLQQIEESTSPNTTSQSLMNKDVLVLHEPAGGGYKDGLASTVHGLCL